MEGDENQRVNMHEPISSDSNDKQAFQCFWCTQGKGAKCQHTLLTIAGWCASRGLGMFEPEVPEPREESTSSSDDDDTPEEGCVTKEEHRRTRKLKPIIYDDDLEFWQYVPAKALRILRRALEIEAEGNAASTLDLTATSESQPSSSADDGPSVSQPKRLRENTTPIDDNLVAASEEALTENSETAEPSVPPGPSGNLPHPQDEDKSEATEELERPALDTVLIGVVRPRQNIELGEKIKELMALPWTWKSSETQIIQSEIEERC